MTSEFACLEAGTILYYTHMMRALSARTGSKRGRHLPAQNASAFALFEDGRDATEVSACFKLQK